MSTKAERERQEARDHLHEYLADGETLYVTVPHVSRSGMLRHMNVYAIRDGKPRYLTYWVAKALGWPMAGDYVKVGGCGMNMVFHLVDSLSSVIGRKLEHEYL